MTIGDEVNKHAVQKLKNKWGGKLPSWEDYKAAYKDGRVRANKTVAAKAIHLEGVPTGYYLILILSTWIGFLIVPSVLIAWIFADFSAWWILVSIFGAWSIIKFSREGYCEGIKRGANNNRIFYDFLVRNGAFLFDPRSKES